MNFNTRVKKIEQKLNLADKSLFAKYCYVTYMTDGGDSEEVKETKKQEAIENKINQMANELKITKDRAKELFNKLDVQFTHVEFV